MRAGINPCDEAKCGPYEQCVINRQGIASCECGAECEPVMRPVCARGGKTYTSLCELKRQACLTRTNIEVAYTGTCGSRGPCSEKVSRRGAEWRVEGTRQIFEYTRRERIKIIARTIIWKSRYWTTKVIRSIKEIGVNCALTWIVSMPLFEEGKNLNDLHNI